MGVRAKYLVGLVYAGASKNGSLALFTDPDDYTISATFNNTSFKTAGFNALQGDDAAAYALGISNENKGFAVDLGGQFQVNQKWTASLAINDIGTIQWKQDVDNYTLVNDQIRLDGFDNLDDIDLAQAFEDSVDVWTERTTTKESFRTAVGMRVIGGASYQLSSKGQVLGSIYRHGRSYTKSEFGFGVGYTQQIGNTLTLSTTLLKEQSRPVELGLGFMLRAASFQLYGVFDDAFNAVKDPADAQSTSFRLGLNFLFGRSSIGKRVVKESKERMPKEELGPFPPEYELDHLLEFGDGGY